MNEKPAYTIRQAAQAALDCQDACNLSGVVFTFARAMQAVCDESHKAGHGTEWKNTHPVVILFLSKLASLARTEGPGAGLDFSRAWEACERLAKGDQ